MPWHSIPTVSDADILDAADLQKYLDNLNYLHTPNVAYYEETNDAANITTIATTWAPISASFQLSLTTVGERVLIDATISSSLAQFDVRVNGTRLGSPPNTTGVGSFGQQGATFQWTHHFMRILAPPAGLNTFDLEWKAISGTATIFTQFRPRFMVRKLTL